MTNYQEPFDIFAKWLSDAKENSQIVEPTAMCLTTVNEQNKPSSRMVLLKKIDQRGFCFFTNLTSRKAGELEDNKNIALCFYWGALGKQVRIEGEVQIVSETEADEYFASRRRESQIGAWASKQSAKMQNDQEFADRIKEIEEKFAGKNVSRPPFWSGFRCVPHRIEFWQEGDFRLHTRDIYQKSDNSWNVSRIYP